MKKTVTRYRILEYVGPKNWVANTIAKSLHGRNVITKFLHVAQGIITVRDLKGRKLKQYLKVIKKKGKK